MSTHAPATIIAITSDEERHRAVMDRAAELASQSGATVILYDLGADLSPLESPLPTEWSGDGQEEQFGDRLDPGDLEAAGQGALADKVRAVRAAGVKAFGWLPDKADGSTLAEYAARQAADLVLVSTEDGELIDALRPSVGAAAGASPAAAAGEAAAGPTATGLRVETVPPA